MRKIRIIEQISLDGVIQSPGGRNEDGDYVHGGWAMRFFDPAILEAIVAAQGTSFDLLLGRRTYDIFAGHWPAAERSPIADGLNAATKYVATHRPDSLGWGPVDEVVLMVCPVVLGKGKRFFSERAAACELALAGTKTAPTGVLLNTYRYVGSLGADVGPPHNVP